jgi:hypothetical protein
LIAHKSLQISDTNLERKYDSDKLCPADPRLYGVLSAVLALEMSTAYMSVDKLSVAEDLVRRAISVEGAALLQVRPAHLRESCWQIF